MSQNENIEDDFHIEAFKRIKEQEDDGTNIKVDS